MANIFIVFITLLAIANGTLLTYLVLARGSLRTRIAIGSVVGITLLAWMGFLSALLFGLNKISIGVTTSILILGLIALIRVAGLGCIRADIGEIRFSKIGIIYYTAWTALLVWLFSRVVMFYPGGLHTAPANNYGDLPFHFSAITSFAYGENLPPTNPIFAGMMFTYPFLIDFLTAFFIGTGADWRAAFFVENIALALALVCLIESLTLGIFRDHLAARLAPVIFLFNGGLGFLNFFRDLSNRDGGLMQFLAHLPKTYTMNNELALASGNVQLRWGNVFTTLLIPQRSMLFGLPIVALIITLWWLAVNKQTRQSDWNTGGREDKNAGNEPRPSHILPFATSPYRCLFAAGILAGLLPMLHAHGFFAVMIASVPMAMLFFSKYWIAFFLPAGLIAAPQALYLSGTQVKDQLFKLQYWWEAGQSNPLVFWMVNAGAFILLLLVAVLMKRITTPKQARFYLPFTLWFIVPNLVLLAPWTWDNIKMLVYWSLISAPFVAVALSYLFTRRFNVPRALAAALFVTLTLSGAIDVMRALSPVENVGLFSREEMEVAELLRAKIPPRAVILHAPVHNSLVALSGRQSVMGYPGHLWTHGINYGQRENDVKTIYSGGASAVEPISRLGVEYILIGPREQSELEIGESFFTNLYPIVIDHAGYRVFQIKR